MIAPSGNSAWEVGNLIHPFQSREKVTLIVQSFLDDTGTDANSRIAGVVGLAASIDTWISWERQWRAFLVDPEVRLAKGWKQSDFGSSYAGRRGEYRGWSEAQWLLARRRVWELLSEDIFGVGCAVVKSDYEEVVALNTYDLPADPYEFCLDRCLSSVLHRSWNLPHGEGIAIYCDQSKEEQEKIGNALAAWHQRYVTLYADVGYRDVPTSTTYGWRMKFIPLQAADIIATEVGRACNSVLNGFIRAEIDKQFPILKELRDRERLPDVVGYSKQDLIAELHRGSRSPMRYGAKRYKRRNLQCHDRI